MMVMIASCRHDIGPAIDALVPGDLSLPPVIRPRALQIEASSFCQLRCPSCPTTSGAIHPAVGSGFLRAIELQRLLDDNPDIAEIELSNYGEIFLNPELPRILEIAQAHKVAVNAHNGVNLNAVREGLLEALVTFGVRILTCSIDGATPETYRRYRVRGEFDRVIGNIRRINHYKDLHRSERPALRWQFIVFGHNQHEVMLAKDMAEDLGMQFVPKLSWDDDLSPPDPVVLRRLFGVASRAEYREKHGKDYMQGICNQLWDSPQVNWDGKMLGCCRNFWGDFGANAFTGGLLESVNGERMNYARRMVRGLAPPRDDIPCTTCDIYQGMQEAGRYLKRDDAARGQRLTEQEALAMGAEWEAAGRLADPARLYQQMLTRLPDSVAATRRLQHLAHRVASRTIARS